MRNTPLVTIAMAGAILVMASTAYAQNPFAIDGIVLDNQNSKTPTGAATKVTDPSGTTKELGPKNGSPQQLGDIHTAPIPMLDDTNPNGNNDLNAIWTQTEQVANGDHWLYFAWSRDTAGTGVIGIELQKDESDCDYTSETTLLACNPWGNRQAGDVIFVWDTQGGATTIVKRVFVENAQGAVVLPPCPQNFPTSQTLECSVVTNAVAVFSNSAGTNLRGEAAINLTAEGLIPPNVCTTFSNTIPFSGTGNSDSADIKDAVLHEFPPISTCGIVKVKKVLLNLTNLTGQFAYRLNRLAGDVRPGVAQITDTLVSHNDEDTIIDLNPAANYFLDETSVSSPFQKVRVFCVLGATTYTLFDSTPADNQTSFPVQGGATTSCTIENIAVGSPQAVTAQSGRLHDQVNLSNVLAHGALQMTATFSLWKNSSNCSTGQLATGPNGATEIAVTVTFTAAQPGQLTTGVANTLGTVGFGTTGDGTYYWKVVLTGDTVNSVPPFCTENTVITFND